MIPWGPEGLKEWERLQAEGVPDDWFQPDRAFFKSELVLDIDQLFEDVRRARDDPPDAQD